MAHEYLDEKEVVRAALEMKMKALLKSKVSTKEIAGILGAEKFLHITKSRSQKHGDVIVFDFKAFVAEEIEKPTPIKLPDILELRPEVFLPPGAGEIRANGEGEGIEEKAIIHRTRFLIDLLTSLKLEYNIVQGTNTETMMRGQSYAVFVVPARKKAVFVNNEEGNATFILHNTDPITNEWELYAQLTKDQLQEGEHVQRVSRHVWPGEQAIWQSQIAEALELDYQPQAPNPHGKNTLPDIELQTKQLPPDGWLPFFKLAAAAGKSRLWVEKRLPALIAAHPEWQGRGYTAASGIFYPPELAAELKKLAAELRKAPDGWLSEGDTAAIVKSDAAWLKTETAKVISLHPKWAPQQFVGKTGITGLFYHPELVEFLNRTRQEMMRVPHGWFTAKDLTRTAKRDIEWVGARVGEILKEHPDWKGKEYLSSRGKLRVFYPPELCGELQRIADLLNKPPVGWLNVAGFVASTHKTQGWVEERISKLLTDHPDWSGKEHISLNGRTTLFYPPELISELNKLATEKQKAPEGWMTTTGIATLIGQTFDRVAKQVEQLVAAHPEWVRNNYLDKGGHAGLDHYSPELVSEVRRINETTVIAPPGWLSEAGVAKVIDKDVTWVRARIPVILSEHPDWTSDQFLDRSGLSGIRQYSPQLVELLRNLAQEYERAPAGWATINGIADLLGRTYKWVNDRVPNLIAERPEWAGKQYRGANEVVNLYYPAPLIDEVRRISSEYQVAPEGWMSKDSVISLIGRTKTWINVRIEEILANHPDWISSKYMDRAGRVGNSLYSPELIAELMRMRDTEGD